MMSNSGSAVSCSKSQYALRMPNAWAAASAVSLWAVQIAATSTPGSNRHALPWTLRLQLALMIPTLTFFPVMTASVPVSSELMPAAIVGELVAHLRRCNTEIFQPVAMLSVLRRRPRCDPHLHALLRGAGQLQTEVAVDASHSAHRVGHEVTMIDVEKLRLPRTAGRIGTAQRLVPIAAFARADNLGARRVALEHA